MTTLYWKSGRATPSVGSPKGAGGKVVAQRKATAAEEKQIRRGDWVRTRPPGQSGKKSSVRPQLAAKQKHSISDKGSKLADMMASASTKKSSGGRR